MRDSANVLNSLAGHSQDPNYKFERLYRLLFNENLYALAYQKLSQNAGNYTKGTDGQTIDGMSIKHIHSIIGQLKDESYRPCPARRIYIPKKNGKQRPLGIPAFKDKLVQEVVRMILESIYEGHFEDCSHGFRPHRGCHTAMASLQKGGTGARWFIEGDIKGFFDNINHDVLIGILAERINDERFLRLIRKFLKAGYMEQWEYKNSYIVKEKELVSLSVYNVGFQSCDSLYQWGPGIRDHYLIHYIISGKGRYTVNGSVHTLTPGDAFLVYPNTEVIYQADAQDPWEYTWVGFTGSDAATILRATDFTKAHPYIHSVSNGNEIKRQLMHIYDARGTEFENALEMTGRLYTTLALFVSAATSKPPQNSANSYVQKGIEYISANYSYPITVEDIASYIGLSRSHLFRSFQSILGVSPKEYLTDFRIKQACYLLKHSSLSITAIAGSIGFDNSLYFSKTFHKIKGLSPKEYRSKYKKAQE